MAAVTDFHGAVLRFAGYEWGHYTADIAFGALGSGASSVEALAGFPLGVWVFATELEILTAFTGEADLAVIVGDTGDPNGLCESVSLDAVAAGTFLGISGAETMRRIEGDLSTDGLAATFTATELDDVSAGSLRVHIKYLRPLSR